MVAGGVAVVLRHVGHAGLVPPVRRLHHPHRPRLGAHHDGVGCGAAADVPHALQQVAVGHAGGGKEDLVALAEVLHKEDGVQVVPLRDRLGALLLVARPQLALDGAAHALHRRRGDDALRRAADAEQDVHGRVGAADLDGGGHVAVADEADAGARLAHLPDELLVARAVKDDGGDLTDGLPVCLRDREQIALGAVLETHRVRQNLRPHDQLLHVHAGARVVERAALRDGDHGDGAVAASGGQGGAIQRVDRNVHVREAAVADPLAAVQHRRLVLLALPDHHGAVHLDGVEHLAHHVDRRLIRRVLVPLALPLARRQGRSLRHADDLQCQVALHNVVVGPVSQVGLRNFNRRSGQELQA
mmetsp:Transcript_13816/g.35487  ORF Transcript_13816/g.35487 Transcript_13816/m.35487 type:complete len:358 (+) Transcript_13816:367-1440(+)